MRSPSTRIAPRHAGQTRADSQTRASTSLAVVPLTPDRSGELDVVADLRPLAAVPAVLRHEDELLALLGEAPLHRDEVQLAHAEVGLRDRRPGRGLRLHDERVGRQALLVVLTAVVPRRGA